jgi:ssDNA-binding replication factor A large subunit
VVADASGSVLLTLWDDAIAKVEAGKSYKIANGFTSLFQNTLRLNIGRYGTIEVTEDIGDVNTENKVSEKEFERPPRRFGGGGFGGGRGGGGFRGGRGGGFGGGRGRGPRGPRREEGYGEQASEEPSEEQGGEFEE